MLPPRSPNLNAHAERFVRTIKNTCLEQMILCGQESLRTAIENFVAHYHTENNHQGLANRIISPEPTHRGSAGLVQRRQRLGGMPNTTTTPPEFGEIPAASTRCRCTSIHPVSIARRNSLAYRIAWNQALELQGPSSG